MFIRFIASSIVAVAVATTALAQTTGTQGGSGGGTTIAPTPNNTGSARTDPGITNSTINSGAVDLNRSGSTINPSGVNPAIPSSPACTNATGSRTTRQPGPPGSAARHFPDKVARRRSGFKSALTAKSERSPGRRDGSAASFLPKNSILRRIRASAAINPDCRRQISR